MKKFIVLVSCSILLSYTVRAQIDNKENLYGFLMDLEDSSKANKLLPKFSSLGNSIITNDSIKGYVTYINIWVAHCIPCIAEILALNNLYATYSSNPKFKFFSFSADNRRTINEFAAKYDIQFPVYEMTRESCYKLNMNAGFPTNMLIDVDGRIKNLFRVEQ